MKHGYSIGSIAIIAVIGVAVLAAWMNYQSTAGINYSNRISDDPTTQKSNMETVKSISSSMLIHASNKAALSVAEAGGGRGSERIWFCNGAKTPPTLHEVLYSISNETLTNLNAYIGRSTEINNLLEVIVSQYSCAKIYPEMAPSCPRTNYPLTCDGWNVSATGSIIQSAKDDMYHKYVGDTITKTDNNRFFWIYYRLLEAEANSAILKKVKERYNNEHNCDSNDPECCITQADLTNTYYQVLGSTLPEFNNYFDSYVHCSSEIECIDLYSLRIKITCTDTKYNIPADFDDEKKVKNLVWIIKEAITLNCNAECAPPGPECGNGACELGESCATCEVDCPCPVCPNGICELGESCATCEVDCPCPVCPNGICELGESCATCEADCGACPYCSDGTCNGGESCATCEADCGACPKPDIDMAVYRYNRNPNTPAYLAPACTQTCFNHNNCPQPFNEKLCYNP